MAEWKIELEFIPEPGYDGVEWHWKAKVLQTTTDSERVVLNPRSYEIEAKYNLGTMEEAQENFDAVLPAYIEALNRPDRTSTWITDGSIQ